MAALLLHALQLHVPLCGRWRSDEDNFLGQLTMGPIWASGGRWGNCPRCCEKLRGHVWCAGLHRHELHICSFISVAVVAVKKFYYRQSTDHGFLPGSRHTLFTIHTGYMSLHPCAWFFNLWNWHADFQRLSQSLVWIQILRVRSFVFACVGWENKKHFLQLPTCVLGKGGGRTANNCLNLDGTWMWMFGHSTCHMLDSA